MNNYTYKYDTHCHTSEVSWCANSTAKEMVRAYHEAGYKGGMVITDHFINGFTRVDRSKPWEVQVEQHCLGYELAKEEADRIGDFDVFFGWEYSDDGTEFLTYGLDKTFLLKHPEMLSWSIETYIRKIIDHGGGFLIQAHPFRNRDYIKCIRLYPDRVGGFEVVNSANVKCGRQIDDEMADRVADMYDLPKTRGTDCHDIKELSGGEGIYLGGKRVGSIEELIEVIKAKEFK